MSIGNLPDNKLISLALHGYNPYQPECGIFCGGYQGLLYPNPTTLSYPNFDPYQYTEPVASEYTPDVDYTGLGIGNPGIDYKNPGHLLGIVDTFGRMSYGIATILAIHNGEDGDDGISPVVGVNVPMIGLEDNTTFGIGDIYPSIVESPSDWLNSFSISANGGVSPDPIPFVFFSVSAGHTPTLGTLDAATLDGLFANKTVLSYYGMPQYFRSVISSLADAADPLANKAELEFTLDSPHIFNQYSHLSDFFPNINTLDHHELVSEGTAISQCHLLKPSNALKVMTGSNNYHDGENGTNEYRSLTELNSVVNLVPLQTVGATYWLDDHSFRQVFTPGGGITYEVDEWTSRSFLVASYMISDLLINVSSVPENEENPQPETVTINGSMTIKSIISDVTAYHWEFVRRVFQFPPPGPILTTIFGNAQSYSKMADIAMSMTNKFTWDKSWLGVGLVTDSDSFNGEVSEITETGGNSDKGFDLLNQDDLVVPFSKTFTLAPGCNSIRMRVFGRNKHSIGQAGGYMVHPDNWIDPSLPNPGVHSAGYVGDPGTVPNNLVSHNIELSFTVTGTKFDPIDFEVSL